MVGRELDPPEIETDASGETLCECRFTDARDVLDEDVKPRDESDEELVYLEFLAHEYLRDILRDLHDDIGLLGYDFFVEFCFHKIILSDRLKKIKVKKSVSKSRIGNT
jgi:hypothetical protein